MTSSNYDDNEDKITGGRNGFGAKLTNIFSTKFIVRTGDKEKNLVYEQTFEKNMGKKSEPKITNKATVDFTEITFYPDFQKFSMEGLDDDIVSLMKKRVYDMAGVTPAKVRVELNGKKLEIKEFKDYCDLYLKQEVKEDHEPPIVLIDKDTQHERWNVIVSFCEDDDQLRQISFVNSICTSKGGTHIDYLSNQIVKRVQEDMSKRAASKKLTIKPAHIKSHLWIFVNCHIRNPIFDSQTKETLTSKPKDFGSKYEFSEKFMKDLIKKSRIIEKVQRMAEAREENKLAKNVKGTKKQKLLGYEKLEDANQAGTKNALNCTLILTEGDSAKGLAMAGISVIGRDTYGAFPLRGKFLNVKDAASKKISDNPEVQALSKIIGLAIGQKYDTPAQMAKLRYGRVLIMTDQDHDGSHIKGLIINFIHHFWPDLLKSNEFLYEFVTPIIKAIKNKETKSFFTIPDFKAWAQSIDNLHTYKIKYYKGLGTSKDVEAKEYFRDLEKHVIAFEYEGQSDFNAIDLAFKKN